MGRFLSIVAVLAAACGDNSDVEGPGPGPNDDIGPLNTGDVIPRYFPQVCGARSWTTNIADDPAMDLSVAPRPEGATILAVPRVGGSMTGFVLDTRMEMVGDGTKVAIDSAFDQVSASFINGRVVS